MEITLLGIDLAKEIFQLHGIDKAGKALMRKAVRRGQLLEFLATIKPCTVAMEACAGSHWLARKLVDYGHKVLLIPPQFVKPYVKGNKNDRADAEAICEAASRPSMHFVAVKGAWHLDVQAIHRARAARVRRRTVLANEIRAIFVENGVAFRKGIEQVRKLVPGLLADEQSELSAMAKELCAELFAELLELDDKIERLGARLRTIARTHEVCRRLLTVKGVAELSATAIVAATPNPAHFKNGRHFAAWLGLVPRHSGSGGKNRIGSITKRGDTYLRTLLVHGARAVVARSGGATDGPLKWVNDVKERRGYNKAAVALAHRNARVMWALMRGDRTAKKEAA